MHIVIAIDSLKGSLTSREAGNAAAEGIRLVYPDAHIDVLPLADGGEGTLEILAESVGAMRHQVCVTGPQGSPVLCSYCIAEEGKTAIIEMFSVAGLTLVPAEERDPMYTTTYGLGEMIRDAIRKGCRRFLVGIGGSATNDGGIGMLQALGYGFYNKHGKPVPYGAAGLRELVSIDRCNVLPELEECSFYVACDVSNPLCGQRGSSVVYGPQKGAAPELIPLMDDWMGQYAALAGELFPHADPDYPGVGAAGGVGFAFLTFTHAVLEPGIDIILRETGVKRYIEKADLVITGEGRLDGQTAMGKAPAGIAKLAKRYGKPVVAFAGGVTEDAGICNTCGIDAFFPIVRSAAALEEVMAPAVARKNMILAAEQVMRLWKAAADR